jgi:hypothetical protein
MMIHYSGCQHTKMRIMIIQRHITASVLIVQDLQKGPPVCCKPRKEKKKNAGSVTHYRHGGQEVVGGQKPAHHRGGQE